MKLFVIEEWVDRWMPRYLQKGEFRWVLTKAQLLVGPCIRVRRVKTPAECDQYRHLNIIGDLAARVKWVN